MSYLILARKWRPKFFDDVVGQGHVVKALVNSLNTKRLHHAWLFSGVRGVGKTSIARILAKSLNCEKGISSHPCGKCESCKGIDSGGSLDYIELDAASNRGVEEMANLLSQTNYTPVISRFKIFLIDEVHMLTGHAFNSMLKTLEEPPEHVKFIFATTDLQKIPITIISRCLCFNLRYMSNSSLVKQLSLILTSEKVSFDNPSLEILARLSKGSMRDALSLVEQAVSYSDGVITVQTLQSMFGMVDSTRIDELLKSILSDNTQSILDISKEIVDFGLSYENVLSEIAILLSKVAILQQASRSEKNIIFDDYEYHRLDSLKNVISEDLLQLLYVVINHSSQELDRAPDQYFGFVMICLRLSSLVRQFYINNDSEQEKLVVIEKNIRNEESVTNHHNKSNYIKSIKEIDDTLPLEQEGLSGDYDLIQNDAVNVDGFDPCYPKHKKIELKSLSSDTWMELISRLDIHGLTLELAKQSEFIRFINNTIIIRVGIPALARQENKVKLQAVLNDYFCVVLKLEILVEAVGDKTVHAASQAQQILKKNQIKQLVVNDSFVKDVVDKLDGDIIFDSISELS